MALKIAFSLHYLFYLHMKFYCETYDMLVNHIMRPGDRLTVTELKRFGGNYAEIYREWHHITKELQMDIRVADMKILDTSLNKELLG